MVVVVIMDSSSNNNNNNNSMMADLSPAHIMNPRTAHGSRSEMAALSTTTWTRCRKARARAKDHSCATIAVELITQLGFAPLKKERKELTESNAIFAAGKVISSLIARVRVVVSTSHGSPRVKAKEARAREVKARAQEEPANSLKEKARDCRL
jgi:hypothetical protein